MENYESDTEDDDHYELPQRHLKKESMSEYKKTAFKTQEEAYISKTSKLASLQYGISSRRALGK